MTRAKYLKDKAKLKEKCVGFQSWLLKKRVGKQGILSFFLFLFLSVYNVEWKCSFHFSVFIISLPTKKSKNLQNIEVRIAKILFLNMIMMMQVYKECI
jgi:hypothetical protein